MAVLTVMPACNAASRQGRASADAMRGDCASAFVARQNRMVRAGFVSRSPTANTVYSKPFEIIA